MNLRPLVAALLLALPSGAMAAEGPAEISRAFFTAYATGDVVRAASYWKSGGAAERFRAAAARTAAARCFVLRHVEVRVTEPAPARAQVELDADAMTWSAIPNAVPVGRSIFKTIELESTGDGWKIVAFRDREEAVASAIAAAAPGRREALARAAGVLRTPLLASLLSRRAITAINRLQFDVSADLLDVAERIAIETGDAVAESEVLAARGTLLYKGTIRDPDAALQYGEQSIVLAEAARDADALARALLRHGRVRSAVLGAIDVPTFQRVVALTDLVEEIPTVGQAHSQLVIAAYSQGDRHEMFRHALLADNYARESGDPANMVNSAVSLGGTFLSQGDLELARVHYERAAALTKQTGSRLAAASIFRQLGMVYREEGKFDEFLKALDEALALGEDVVTVDVLLLRASYRIDIGDLAGAEADLKAAQEKERVATEESRDTLLETRMQLLVKQGRCEEALRIAPDPCKGKSSCAAAFGSVSALSCLGRKAEATAVAARILDDTERSRAMSAADVSQRSFLQERQARVYDMMVELLVDQERFREALAVADRSKARLLADARSHALLTANRLTGADRAAYDRLNERIRALNRAILEGKNADALRADLEKTRADMRELFARADAALAARPSNGRSTGSDEPVPAPQPGVAVIEYLSTQDRLFAFAVTRSESGEAVVSARAIPVKRDDLKRLVDRHLSAIEQRDLRVGERSRELYELLLAPFEPLLRRHRALCIIPAGDLWRVPFHALQAKSGRYLIETTSVFYAPSIAAMEIVRAPHAEDAPATILALANPNIRAKTRSAVRALHGDEPLAAIPETEREVRALETIYGPGHSRILVGDDAQESSFKRESPNYSVLHIAAHGVLDEHAPWYSALALSAADDREDGLLEAREIAELPLRANLAVLSACETGRGRASAGEGVIGFSWALLAAGCPNAVVSQWRAESTAAMELMIDFHRELVRSGGRSPSAALRHAQLSLMRRYPHPYYWAPFIVVGRDR